MSTFNLDSFITELRGAAEKADASKAIRALMNDAFQDPDAIKAAMSGYSGFEEVLYEDDGISIWYVGFNPDDHVPPHDHQIQAFIGVYDGAEKNHFYLVGDSELEHKTTKVVEPGDVIAIGPEGIHSVETANDQHCYGIHVYLGALTKIERSLFDWETGAAEPFNEDSFNQMIRPSVT